MGGVLGHSKVYQSAIVAVAGDPDITVPVEHAFRHWFASVEYFKDAAGTTPGVPTAGTETYVVKTPTKSNDEQGFAGNVINSADKSQVNWESPTKSVKCSLASVSGGSVTHARVKVIGTVS